MGGSLGTIKEIKEISSPINSLPKVPLVFHPYYDISFMGIEKLHPFDSKKYGKVHKYLLDKLELEPQQFFKPKLITDEDLLQVHTPEYLNSLKYSYNIAKITEVPPLALIPNFLLRSHMLEPMKYGTAGTLMAADIAMDKGWAINLSGGYHHAKSDSGGGFCIYADIPLAIYKLREEYPGLKCLIVDLDAHQGNGHEAIIKDDPQTRIFDVYNGDIYPNDKEAKKYIDYDFPVRSNIHDLQYMYLLKKELPKAVKEFKPHLIIYNAGTDVYQKDPLGNMNITKEGIIARDEFVFKTAFENKSKILMVLSGGYTSESYDIIGESVYNIVSKLQK